MTAESLIGFVAAAVGRDEWGRAMRAELTGFSSPRARRRFAAGCLRALVVSLPPVAVVTLVAGLLAGTVVLVAALRLPGVVTGPGTWVAFGCFGCVVALYVLCAACLAAWLREARLTTPAVVAASGIAASWMAIGFSASVALPTGVPIAVLGLDLAMALAFGWLATERAGSLRTGLLCVGFVAVIAGIAVFLLWAGESVAFAGRPYDAGLLRDFRSSGVRDLATYAVGDSLGTAMVLLLLVPLVSLTAGLVGCAAAAGLTRVRLTR
jgi:hypothetical protein